MSDEYLASTYSLVREVIGRLQSPIKDQETLLVLLAAPLAAWKVLPPRFVQYNKNPLPSQGISVPRHAPPLQRALLELILPTWGHILDENDFYILVQQYFSPDLFSFSRPAAKQLAVHAYSTILSLPFTDHSVRLLTHLCKSYPIDVLWSAVVSDRNASARSSVTWEDCVRDVASVPGKVANAMGPRGAVPPDLEYGAYFNNLSRRCRLLCESLTKPSQGAFFKVKHR